MGGPSWGPEADGYEVSSFYEGRLTSFPLLRIKSGTKIPMDRGWSSLSRKPAEPGPWRKKLIGYRGPLAVVCGAGHAVLDVDLDVPGAAESFQRFVRDTELDTITPTVSTPSGGLHLYLRTDARLKSAALVTIGYLGLDFKAEGGYVLAPPSDGYTYLDDLDVEPVLVGERLVELVGEAGEASGGYEPKTGDQDENERVALLLQDRFGATIVAQLRDGTFVVRRPGKDEGHSGTVGKVGKGRFKNFSSSWEQFNTSRAYTEGDLRRMLGEGPTITVPPADEPVRALRWQSSKAIVAQPVYWLWPDRLALASLVLLVGREGMGKGVLSAWLSAQVSTGALPGQLHGIPASVLWLSTEDSWATTIRPRLEAAGADLDRVGMLVTPDGIDGVDLVPEHIEAVAEVVEEQGVRLVVLDPLISAVPIRLDAYKEQHARAALKPLRDLAEQTGASVLGLTHFGKGHQGDAMTAVLNSRGFTATARGVLMVGYDPDEDPPKTRIVRVEKSNLGRLDVPGWSYTIVEHVVGRSDEGYAISAGQLVEKGEMPNPPSAEQMMRPGERASASAVDEAMEFLRDVLAEGEMSSAEVKTLAIKEDITEKVLRTARERLGVEMSRAGRRQQHQSYWRLPTNGDA